MKILKGLLLTSVFAITSFAPLHTMEPVADEHELSKSYIFDIQDYAEKLTAETGVTYKIVTKPKFFAKFLEILGLSDTNTLLDIKYHYELMKAKLLGQDEALKAVTAAYNQVMGIISEVEKYKKEVQYLWKISFEDLQSIEIKNGNELGLKAFLESKNRSVNKAIASLKKQYPQRLPLILQTAFNLSADASPHMVDEGYKQYVQNYKDYSNRLVAHATIKTISIQDLKDSLAQLEKVSKAYEQYVQERGQK